MQKILVIRFSSIGDIVLTTPVLRCLKQQLAGATIHYVTKAVFAPVLNGNPYIDKMITFKKDISEIYAELQAENYDLVIDLHKNLRSLRLKQKLGVKSYAFKKLNVQKFLAVNLKMITALPPKHIVERYMETAAPLGVKNDNAGLDYFLDKKDRVDIANLFFNGKEAKFIALVIGGSYYTKKIPLIKLQEICRNASLPVLALGGKEDVTLGEALQKEFPSVMNTCGKFSINQSAFLVKQAEWVITSDTGLMHIASAFQKKIISVWGNTIPEFGMGPYLPAAENRILEIKGLNCRPCSKLGYQKCPKGHFKCMLEIDYSFVKELK